jgi:transcriptional/translational regulatory protein YebC/TACO1
VAGHNKWSKVKRAKAVTDARKGKVFSRLSRDITMAACTGTGELPGGVFEEMDYALSDDAHA